MKKTRKRIAFVVLAVCIVFAQALARRPADDAKQVVQEFWISEIQGRTLTPAGQLSASHFFVRPSLPGPVSKIFVIPNRNGWGIQETATSEHWAEVDVGTIELGELHSDLRFEKSSHLMETRTLIRFDVVRTTKHWELTPPYGILGPVLTGPPAWRIASVADPAPWVTVETAVRYVAEKRDQSKSDAIKKNANATLAVLEKLKD